MIFKKYPKIHRLGKEETEGILDGKNVHLIIQEKIDGANTSIWIDNNVIKCGSRTRELPNDESFNGFTEWAKSQKSINEYLKKHPTHILYGEWLVRHTIQYNELAYKKWYLFDIFDAEHEEFISPKDVAIVAKEFSFDSPKIFAEGDISLDEIKSFVGKSDIGLKGEGIVIKRHGFINNFGNHCYAKLVTPEFTEDNVIIFGGNNKNSDTYQEMYFVNKYCTLARVQKIMNKVQPLIDKRLDLEHTPRITNTCYHDMITEEAWEIAGFNKVVDFRQLRNLSHKKFVQIYKDILNGNLSVADKREDNESK